MFVSPRTRPRRLSAEDEHATEEKLRWLVSWEESGHDFGAKETESLIAAIDGLKALDPAVGSGAFPMGVLHKLVFILGYGSQGRVKEMSAKFFQIMGKMGRFCIPETLL
jgi:hypothetical protein